MDLDFSKLQPDEELDQNWQPQKDIYTICQRLIPWICTLAAFVLMGCLICFLESVWRSSPLFFLVALVGKLCVAIAQFLFGLVQLIFSGHASIIKQIPDVFSSEEARRALPPLIISLLCIGIPFRILSDASIKREATPYVLIGSIVVTLAVLVIPQSKVHVAWITDIGKMFSIAFGN